METIFTKKMALNFLVLSAIKIVLRDNPVYFGSTRNYHSIPKTENHPASLSARQTKITSVVLEPAFHIIVSNG